MKTKIISALVLSVILLNSCDSKRNIEHINGLTILHLSGTPYEQGYAHGQLLQSEIDSTLSKWKKEVEQTHDTDLKSVIADFFESTKFIDDIRAHCPDLLDEVRGIADGSRIDFETILAFQLSEEMDAPITDKAAKHCTSVSINANDTNPTFLAQNMDPPYFLHGFPTLLHIIDKENNIESYVYTFPGFIGLTGINSESIGITCNSLSMLRHSEKGLPVSFIVRKILQQKNEADAFGYLESVPIGIPQCFTIGGKTEARCYECSAHEKRVFHPFGDKSITLHTNFAAINRDFSDQFINLLKTYGKTVDDPYFCPRYYLAYDKIIEADYQLNYAIIKSILSLTEPETEPISGEDTYGCIIMELSENPLLHIAPGKPDQTEFISITFQPVTVLSSR